MNRNKAHGINERKDVVLVVKFTITKKSEQR